MQYIKQANNWIISYQTTSGATETWSHPVEMISTIDGKKFQVTEEMLQLIYPDMPTLKKIRKNILDSNTGTYFNPK